MNTNERITTSPALGDNYDAIVQQLTGVDLALPVATWLADAGLDRRTVNDLENRILQAHFDGTRAAFAAGVHCGLHPEQVLLVRLSALAERIDAIADRLEGAQ